MQPTCHHRFLFASDSFKGSLSSKRSAELLREAALKHFPDACIHMVEVADGGEGTVAAVTSAAGGTTRTVTVNGPLGQPVAASYGLLDHNRAIIEMAAASGLTLVPLAERNPMRTSTFGTGELILDALDQGARDITLAIGGSATNDGGMGCMRALGARFLDAHGCELDGMGADLSRVDAIDVRDMDPRLADARFTVMCDVDNPLVGAQGATRVFGGQKGGTPDMLDELEAGMAHFAGLLESAFCGFDPMAPGMGAAGGLGAAAATFLHARLRPGVESVLQLVDFDRMLQDCTLCITGEGHADAQSAHGKVVSGVAAHCKQAQVPCIAIVGGMDADAQELLNLGIQAIVPTVPDICSVEEALTNAERNYRMAAERVFALLSLGQELA